MQKKVLKKLTLSHRVLGEHKLRSMGREILEDEHYSEREFTARTKKNETKMREVYWKNDWRWIKFVSSDCSWCFAWACVTCSAQNWFQRLPQGSSPPQQKKVPVVLQHSHFSAQYSRNYSVPGSVGFIWKQVKIGENGDILTEDSVSWKLSLLFPEVRITSSSQCDF